MKWRKKAAWGLAVFAVLLSARPALSEEAEPRLKVLTINVWGIVSAKARVVRSEAIGQRIAELDPDIVAIEEAFERRHREALFSGLEKGGYEFADYRYFRNNYGSGILFISRYPIEEALFEAYRVNCAFYDIERLGGKGIAHLCLRTPWGRLDFFHTHALARMTPIFDREGNFLPGDPKQIDRLIQMYQIDRFVRTQKSGSVRSIVAAGDFNVSPEMLEYRMLVELTGFENSFEALHPGENPSTFSTENVYVKDDYSRIDHIFFKNYEGEEGFWVRPLESRVEMTQTFPRPGKLQEINLSDHYAVFTEFEVITEEGLVSPSPEGVVPLCCPCQECPLSGYRQGVLELDPANSRAWQDLALEVFGTAYWKKQRNNPLVLPMAEVVASADCPDPVRIEFSEKARARLEDKVCRGKCEPPAAGGGGQDSK